MVRPLVLAVSVYSLFAQHTDEYSKARELYIEAVYGNRDAGKQSRSLLERMDRSPKVLAYIGSLHVLESGRTVALWKRGRLAREGLKLLDEAISTAPNDVEIRFLRAASTFHLPAFFDRTEQCGDDLARVVKSADKIDRRYAAAAYSYYGSWLKNKGDSASAKVQWKRAVSAAPDSRAGRQAAEFLRDTNR